MTHSYKQPFSTSIYIKELKTSARRAEIANALLNGAHKDDIIKYLMDYFGMEYKQAKSEYKQGYSYIYQQCELSKEEIRKLNLSRLEELWDRAEKDEELEKLTTRDYYRTQLKNIDVTNKTCGLYQADEEKSNQDITLKFDLGDTQNRK